MRSIKEIANDQIAEMVTNVLDDFDYTDIIDEWFDKNESDIEDVIRAKIADDVGDRLREMLDLPF